MKMKNNDVAKSWAKGHVASGSNYQTDGQTITIEERRTVVAATAVVSATAIAVRPAPPTPIPTAGPSGPSGGGPVSGPSARSRGRNN